MPPLTFFITTAVTFRFATDRPKFPSRVQFVFFGASSVTSFSECTEDRHNLVEVNSEPSIHERTTNQRRTNPLITVRAQINARAVLGKKDSIRMRVAILPHPRYCVTNCTGYIDGMSCRETKKKPNRARSSRQISCCLIPFLWSQVKPSNQLLLNSLPLLCDILLTCPV